MYKKVGFLILLIGAWSNAADNPAVGAGVEAVAPLHEALLPRVGAGYHTVSIDNASDYRVYFSIMADTPEGLAPRIPEDWLDSGMGRDYYFEAGEYIIFYDFPDSPNPADRRQEGGGTRTENISVDENIAVDLDSID